MCLIKIGGKYENQDVILKIGLKIREISSGYVEINSILRISRSIFKILSKLSFLKIELSHFRQTKWRAFLRISRCVGDITGLF